MNPVTANLYNFLKDREQSGIFQSRAVRSFYHFFLKYLSLSWWSVTEHYETKIVRNLIKPGMTVVDVGANVGYYTILMAKQVGPEGRVFAFEPDPVNFRILEYHILKGRYTNVVLEQKAVGRTNGSIKLYQSASNPGDHRIYDLKDGRNAVPISLVSLDEYFKDLKRPIEFIKIDVQGSESGVLEGMSGILKNPGRSKQIKILTEFWPDGLKRFGSQPQAYLKNLKNAGLFIEEIDSKHSTLKEVDPAVFPWQEFNPDDYINLLCRRPEDRGPII